MRFAITSYIEIFGGLYTCEVMSHKTRVLPESLSRLPRVTRRWSMPAQIKEVLRLIANEIIGKPKYLTASDHMCSESATDESK